jgi:hypothetical protein
MSWTTTSQPKTLMRWIYVSQTLEHWIYKFSYLIYVAQPYPIHLTWDFNIYISQKQSHPPILNWMVQINYCVKLAITCDHHLAITCGNESWFFKMLNSIVISEIGVVLAQIPLTVSFLLMIMKLSFLQLLQDCWVVNPVR